MRLRHKFILFNVIVVAVSVLACTAIAMKQFYSNGVSKAVLSQEARLKTLKELLHGKGSQFRIANNKLMVGNYALNDNFEVPDKLKEICGGTATIFMRDVRVFTNVLKPDGSRAIGTKLQGPAYDAVFKAGTSYHGEADILGTKYFTAYDPIKNAQGETIGAIYVGVKKSEFLADYKKLALQIGSGVLLLLIISSIAAIIFAKSICKPIAHMMEVLGKAAEWDLSVTAQCRTKDEFSLLAGSVNKMMAAVKALVDDTEVLVGAAMTGDLAKRADAAKHQGEFRNIIEGVNGTLDAVVEPILDASRRIDELSRGEIFDEISEGYQGDFAPLKESLNRCRNANDALRADVRTLCIASYEGDLTTRLDPEAHQGFLAKVIGGMNNLFENLSAPLQVSTALIEKISKGEIPEKITEEYRGDYNGIKDSINRCIDGLDGLVEANAVLQRMAVNDHTQQVEGEYQGIYQEVGQAVNEVRQRVLNAARTANLIARCDLSDLEFYKSIGNGTGRRSENDNFAPAYIGMMEAINAMLAYVDMLAQAAINGNLLARADAEAHHGEFRRIIEGFNNALDGIVGPFYATAESLCRLGMGEIPEPIEVEFKGDFNDVKESLNSCIGNVNSLVADVNMLVQAALDGSFDTRADAAAHSGDFSKIVEGINKTVDTVVDKTERSEVA